jgi:hypothetical protein
VAETAEKKIEKDLKTLPKSVPTPKPLNYVGNPDAEVQATRFGNLELRADLESRLALSPVAQLGYDIIERGLLEPTAGEMGGDIVPRFGGGTSVVGLMLPSTDLNPAGEDTPTGRRFFDADVFKADPEGSGLRYMARDLDRFGKGIEGLLSSDRGSTVIYDSDQPKTEIKDGKVVDVPGTIDNDYSLNTLMEELAHVGVRELERRGMDVRSLRTEENAMDMLQAELALSEGMMPKSDQQVSDMSVMKNKYMSIPRNVLEDYNEAALAVLDERGVPRRAVPKKQETGMVDSMLNFFGLK